MKSISAEISYEEVLGSLSILAQTFPNDNDVIVVEHWVRQARQQLRELEQVNDMYRTMAETQARLNARR